MLMGKTLLKMANLNLNPQKRSSCKLNKEDYKNPDEDPDW